MKTVKSLLKKSGDPYLALLAYRVTPLSNGYSPSQLLMGRILCSTLPTTREARKPYLPDRDSLQVKEKEQRRKQKEYFDHHHGVKELPLLEPGDLVWVSDRQEAGAVGEQVGPRSYNIETPSGSFRRNRSNLITLPETENEHEETDTSVNQPPVWRSTRVTFQPDRYNTNAH